MSKRNKTEFIPTIKQKAYLEAFVNAKAKDTKTSILKRIHVSRMTACQWEHNPKWVNWFRSQVEDAMRLRLTNVYTALYRRALTNVNDCRLFLQRFDPDYKERLGLEHSGNLTLTKLFDEIEKKKTDGKK